jgi:hypothetical protein
MLGKLSVFGRMVATAILLIGVCFAGTAAHAMKKANAATPTLYEQMKDWEVAGRVFLNGISEADFNNYSNEWDRGTFDTLAQSLEYHARGHFPETIRAGNLGTMLRSASSWNKSGAIEDKQYAIDYGDDGKKKFTKGGFYMIYTATGKKLSYGRVTDAETDR